MTFHRLGKVLDGGSQVTRGLLEIRLQVYCHASDFSSE